SSVGVAVDLLFSLSHFVPHDEFEDIGADVLRTHGKRVEKNPLQHLSLVLAGNRHTHGSLEMTVVGELPKEWRKRISKTYLPDRILSRRPADPDEFEEWLEKLDLSETPPIWDGRTRKDSKPTLYVCRSFTCSPPLTDIDDGLEWVEKLET
ncbi:MAG: thioredoxin domain-containing protein, partial [Candidatus Aenigmatarchaeota archaeon]